MKRRDGMVVQHWLVAGFVAAAVLVVLAGCSRKSFTQPASSLPASVSASATGAQRYGDPFSYCRAVGTIDRPDARYAGPEPPPAVLSGLIKALRAQPSATGSEAFERGTYWRCMDGVVYACNVGANLPCESHADTGRTPTSGEHDYCAAHPGADFIPMYVTGHATIYDWYCDGATAVAGKQLAEVDARGFIAGIWHRISAPATSQ